MKFTKAPLVFSLVLALASTWAAAHEVWLERDANGPVRVYLGEPGEPDSGDAINKLKNSLVFTDTKAKPSVISQQADHWQAAVTQAGDVRLFTDSVWAPWETGGSAWWEFWQDDNSQMQGAILEARAGREQTQAKLNFELVPTSPGSNQFTAYFQGATLVNHSVELRSPAGDMIEVKTDSKGNFTVATKASGRYLLSSSHTVPVTAMHSGQQVQSLLYITSLTFVAP